MTALVTSRALHSIFAERKFSLAREHKIEALNFYWLARRIAITVVVRAAAMRRQISILRAYRPLHS
jgi:hypothetical protein